VHEAPHPDRENADGPNELQKEYPIRRIVHAKYTCWPFEYTIGKSHLSRALMASADIPAAPLVVGVFLNVLITRRAVGLAAVERAGHLNGHGQYTHCFLRTGGSPHALCGGGRLALARRYPARAQ